MLLHQRRISLLLTGALGILSGCATYQPQPLVDQSPLATSLKILQLKASALHNPHTVHEINPADGFDLTEVATLAVLGNPGLRAQRAKLGVASAQAFAAGLLPDPQLSASLDKPMGDTTGLVNAWGAGMAFDIVPLITRQARIDAKQNAKTQIRLGLLWQEWQVIQQAQTLAVRYRLEQQRLALLNHMRSLYKKRFQHSLQGLKQGNITLDVNGTDLTALLGTFSQINQLEQTHNQTRHDLSLLLGLQADVSFSISPLPADNTLTSSQIKKRLQQITNVRPDLLALKAGYRAQENRVRAAILAQFPSFTLGISRARDTGSVNTSGLTIGLTIPVFSGNRGTIAIERATRSLLQSEYQSRLAQADNDVNRLLDQQAIITEQQVNLTTYLPRLQAIVSRSRSAYKRGDIDALTFLNLETTLLNKQLEVINLQQTRWQIYIALKTLLALPENEDHSLTGNQLLKNK